MGEKRQYIIYFICLLFTAGCAALHPVKTPVGERIVNKPYEVVWNRTVESLPRAGEFVLDKNAEKGLIVIEKRIYGSHLFSEYSGFSWYFGKIRVNVSIGKVSDKVTRVAVKIDFVELYDATRGRLDILSSAEIFREEILFTNLSTKTHYLDHIENAVNQEKLVRKPFFRRTAWGDRKYANDDVAGLADLAAAHF